MTCVCITEQMQRHTENVVWRWRQRQQQCFYKPRHVKNCCYKKLEGCATDSSWVPRRNQTCQQLWFWVSSLKNYERISSVVLSHLVLWYLVLHYSNPRKLLHRRTFSFFPLLFFASLVLKILLSSLSKGTITYPLWVPSWRMRSERLPKDFPHSLQS